ncbi:MAG: pseudouridylate synthase [Fusobacteriaceae bacterium]
MRLNLRALEKNEKFGFMFYISYEGSKFHCFDEMTDKNTVKGTFKNIMNSIGFTWAKGVQQAGRTDAKVSATENILYVSSLYSGKLQNLKKEFNKNSEFLKIKEIVKTFPNLEFPELIEKREYTYLYPQNKMKNSEEEIKKRCIENSGTGNMSKFTDTKGLALKEHRRTVSITYVEGKLNFIGDSFMPKQVRIMASYILNDTLEPLPGKYLTLEKIYLKEELQNMVITPNNDVLDKTKIEEDPTLSSEEKLEIQFLIHNVLKVEKIGNSALIFYVKKGKKTDFVGKSGNVIKKLKKKYGNIVVREMEKFW